MAALTDVELARVRLRYIDMIKSLFLCEPNAELLLVWQVFFSTLAIERVSPSFDQAVRNLNSTLGKKDLTDLQDEYYRFFSNPFSSELVEMTASYHLDGRSYGQSLVAIRAVLKETDIFKEAEVTEPEDSLVVMLDILATLIENEDDVENLDAKSLQETVINEYLRPSVDQLVKVLAGRNNAEFYQHCALFLASYLDLEKGLL